MAVRIVKIVEDPNHPSDSIQRHSSIRDFNWINEVTQKNGTSTRETMFDWIVNKKGAAYLKSGNDTIPVYGALSPSGVPYIRALRNGEWTDDLFTLA